MKASELPEGEYNPYYRPYINALGAEDLMPSLEYGLIAMVDLITRIPESKLGFKYDTGKWTIAEVLMDLIDTERIFQYRALRFYRKETTPLPGFDQDVYILECGASTKTKAEILDEYTAIRNASIALFRSFKQEFLNRNGIASNSIMSVRALGFIISGHQIHHLNILKERYLISID
ncbi:DinB family protein [Croceitalea rosinachiae]|uniref:DinB family protein n=1 Tax=Croceitalea rosinachiae TaxID=3075596 RepID=A0ABU3AF31_9FLAO|nr:DinB family protein [Croceitalea sp. F388]MDT0607471.1 DinB family protein [Croceitalea sp. F388]